MQLVYCSAKFEKEYVTLVRNHLVYMCISAHVLMCTYICIDELGGLDSIGCECPLTSNFDPMQWICNGCGSTVFNYVCN